MSSIRATLNHVVPLKEGANVSVMLKNCAVGFYTSDLSSSRIVVKSWVHNEKRFRLFHSSIERKAFVDISRDIPPLLILCVFGVRMDSNY